MPPLAADVALDRTTWGALALVLTLVGAGWTWLSLRRRGLAAGLRALAWTLVPVAAWLTGTLRLAAQIAGDVLTWATRLVFSPLVWAGVAVGVLAVVLWVVSGFMLGRGIGVRREVSAASRGTGVPTGSTRTRTRPSTGASGRGDDVEGMDEIEAILKRRGI